MGNTFPSANVQPRSIPLRGFFYANFLRRLEMSYYYTNTRFSKNSPAAVVEQDIMDWTVDTVVTPPVNDDLSEYSELFEQIGISA